MCSIFVHNKYDEFDKNLVKFHETNSYKWSQLTYYLIADKVAISAIVSTE